MCQNCKSSELGIQRRAELDAAIAECKELNINHATVGFIAKHAYRGRSGRAMYMTNEQTAAIKRYNDAQQAMKDLHNDYVFALGRAHVQEMKERGIQPTRTKE